MRWLYLFLIVTFSICVNVDGKNCKESNEIQEEEPCDETEYMAYITCMRRRTKRSIDSSCEEESDCEGDNCGCDQCDCNYCASHYCEDTCSNCCRQYSACEDRHCCHKSCHSQCRTNQCRKSCRRSCGNRIQTGKSENKARHNITTIINLKNLINNTNIIDIPITLNNTNLNNITIDRSDSLIDGGGGIIGGGGVGGIIGGGGTVIGDPNINVAPNSKCCHIISPQQCVPTQQFPFMRCFHVRSQKCGNICRAPVVHVQRHEICDENPPRCSQQMIYIPQPTPRCTYQQKWPFVSCGIREAECTGCYAHHSNGEAYVGGCSPACFDDGYGAGPMYRQGPFYRPGNAAVPSCYQLGNCGTSAWSSGYGLYGAGYPPQSYNTNLLGVIPTSKSNTEGQPSPFFNEIAGNYPLQYGANAGNLPLQYGGEQGNYPLIYNGPVGNSPYYPYGPPGNISGLAGGNPIYPSYLGLLPSNFYIPHQNVNETQEEQQRAVRNSQEIVNFDNNTQPHLDEAEHPVTIETTYEDETSK